MVRWGAFKPTTLWSVLVVTVAVGWPIRAAAETLLGGWTFDETPASPDTPTVLPANLGLYLSSANLYANGTNGSSSWLVDADPNATQWNAPSGNILNDPRASTLSGRSIAPTNSASNGLSIVFMVPTSAYQDLTLSLATRGNTGVFTTHNWAYSTNGMTFAGITGNTAETGTSFALKSLNLPAGAANVAMVYLRLTVDGATAPGAVARLDNILVSSHNFTWFGDTSSSFTTAANWIAPGLNATFSTAPTNASSTRINFAGSPANNPSITSATTSGSIMFNSDAAAVNVGGAGTWTVHGGFENRSANTQTIATPVILGANQVWLANAGGLVFNGPVNDNGKTLTLAGDYPITLTDAIGGGAGALVKNGDGIATLGGVSNLYGGTTSVNAGMLIVNGALSAGGGAVGVTGSGILSGIGTIGRNLTIGDGGTVSPGNGAGGIGALTVDSSASTLFLGGGTYIWEVTGASAGQADTMSVEALTISATSGMPFTIKIDSLGTLSGLAPATEYRWTIASATSIAGYDVTKFALNLEAFTADIDGSFFVDRTDNNLQLVYQTSGVPEPIGGALVISATALILRRRRT